MPFFLGQLQQRKQDILEVACGTGSRYPIAQAGHRVTAFDFDPRMIEIARRKANFVGHTPERGRGGRAVRLQVFPRFLSPVR